MVVNIKDKHVGNTKIPSLIRRLNFIFHYDFKNIEGCHFEITCKYLDPTSALILFKIFDYSKKNQCLENPSANLEKLLNLFKNYNIEKLMKRLINQKQVGSLYKDLKPMKIKDFFIAPHPINRENFKDKIDLENKYAQFISDYYKDICPNLVNYFKTCICEIASNFLYHATEDDNSILMALGNKNSIEIVCVDNSTGIISSLDAFKSQDKQKVMENAFKRGITSKIEDYHCGTGLWEVEQIVKQLNGTLKVYSEDVCYICRNDFKSICQTPYWKGSIFYLKLYVSRETNIDEFFDDDVNSNNLGLINK